MDTKEPIEIGDFVSAFTSVSNQYSKFISENHPELSSDARIFVREIQKGSIVADLIPFVPLLGLSSLVPAMQQIDVVVEFVQKYGSNISKFFGDDRAVSSQDSASDLKDFLGAVAAIAADPDGKSLLEGAYFENGIKQTRAVLRFDTQQARRAVDGIEENKRQLESREHASRERVLMVFTQSNIKTPPIDKRTGEKVQIEEISFSELPLVYASDLAEQKIKHEIREADENVFKKGFIVDVSVLMKSGRPIAYRVTNLHQVIDLPDT